MLSIHEPIKKSAKLPTMMRCLPLPEFDARDFKLVREIFRLVERHPLGQAWLETEEHDFAPAFVRTGWRGNLLLVFAELIDFDVYNAATALNQPAWELGDTFEIFLQPVGHSAYVEFQVTPDNHRVQLRFANVGAAEEIRKSGSMESAFIPGEAFRSRTWIQPGAKCWYVYAELNAAELRDHAGSLQGRQWRVSFSRYDYTRNRNQPVISSTSPHAEPDFHRQEEWSILCFETLTPPSDR
jgi:hypothetical protein